MVSINNRFVEMNIYIYIFTARLVNHLPSYYVILITFKFGPFWIVLTLYTSQMCGEMCGSRLFRLATKKQQKSPLLAFCEWNLLVDFPHKGSVLLKAYSYHGVIMPLNLCKEDKSHETGYYAISFCGHDTVTFKGYKMVLWRPYAWTSICVL